MIDEFVAVLATGVRYVRAHPQLFFTILLIVVIPVAFYWNGHQFLSASQDNEERLEKDRIGLLHDAFLSIIDVTDADPGRMQEEIDKLSKLNPDIVAFRVSKKTDQGFIPVAALDQSALGQPEPDSAVYNYAFTNPDESIVQVIELDGTRYLRGVRLASTGKDDYVIFTLTSRAAVDALFQSRIQSAYVWLVVLLAVVLLLVIRHVRLIDYAYLYQQTKKANEAKDLFTNMIAHELRAPLTAIRGYASLITERDDIDETTKMQASRIEQSSERLVLIISDLLDVARIQSGKLSMEKGDVDLIKVIGAVLDELNPIATEKHIELKCEACAHRLSITGDSKRLHQALTNLVSNAIKYTKEGSITVGVEEKHDRVELRVKDTGMGIAAPDQKGLFAPFYRVQTNDVSKITGTGLGMWITKQLIELMGASIAVESIKGVGTHVVVTFPKN